VSRGGATRSEGVVKAGTPIWVWLVYGLGIFAALVIVFSLLFTAGAHFLGGAGYEASPLAFVVWGGVLLIAAGTWLARRRRR
jgi:LPXTG-motif cell wall-anchored protein